MLVEKNSTSILNCGTKVYGSSGTKVQLGKQILQNSNVEVQCSPRVSPTELSRQVIRGLRNSAGVLKTCWEDLSQFLRKCLSKGLHLSGWQNIFETNLLRRELKDKF